MLSGSYKTEGASRHSFSAMAPNAVTVRTLFSRRTSITVDIDAEPAIIWTLLTQAAHYPNWNSTVISIEGDEPLARHAIDLIALVLARPSS